MWAAVKTHLRGWDMVKQAKAQKAKYHSTMSEAKESPNSADGTHGGAWLAVSRHLNSSKINGDTGAKCFDKT